MRDREVGADDAVHRDDQRRGQRGQQVVGLLVALPVARGAAPAERQHAVDHLLDARRGAVAQAGQVRDQPEVPEDQRDREVRARPRRSPRPAGCGTGARRPSSTGTGTASRRTRADRGAAADTARRCTTAKIVIASAKRLIEVRHCCLSRNRMAEISVPAWPMPIHHTKLVIAKPQATGNRHAPDADADREQLRRSATNSTMTQHQADGEADAPADSACGARRGRPSMRSVIEP